MRIPKEDLKKLALHKKGLTEQLMEQGQWVLAAEQMAYSLEMALKAACCVTLGIDGYPPLKPNKKNEEMGFFKQHHFDTLLIFSGMNDILGPNLLAWGNFTTIYGDDWNELRYDLLAHEKYTETKVRELYALMYEGDDSIIGTIERNKRW